MSAENVRDRWAKITDFETNPVVPESLNDTLKVLMDNIERNADRPQADSGADAGSGLKADKIYDMMGEYLARGFGKDLVGKVGSVFQFDIKEDKKGPVIGSWEIDLKNGQGHCKKQVSSGADATFTMTDDDFEGVCLGTLNPQMAFMQGKMKIKGNMGKAAKFTPDLFPPPTAENIAKYARAKA